jgi:hypothetical protein
MTVQYEVVVTCDRCGSESRHSADADDRRAPAWWSEYAVVWPSEVGPYRGYTYPHLRPREELVCSSCLTGEEREQLADATLKLDQHEAFPL